MTTPIHYLSKTSVPNRQGWYWLYEKSRPNFAQLYRIFRYRDETDTNAIRCSAKGKASTPETWEYLKQQGVDHLEFIGEELPGCIMPSQSGYYWVTARNGTRGIVKVRRVEGEFPETRVEVIGSQYTYDWLSVVEMYQAVRIDFIGEADEYTPRMS